MRILLNLQCVAVCTHFFEELGKKLYWDSCNCDINVALSKTKSLKYCKR